MTKTRTIFLFLFVGLLLLSAFQFFMLETSDLNSISMVEEQQETIGFSVEVIGEDFKSVNFNLFSGTLVEAFQQKYSIVHIDKEYPPIHLDVPHSPPDLG